MCHWKPFWKQVGLVDCTDVDLVKYSNVPMLVYTCNMKSDHNFPGSPVTISHPAINGWIGREKRLASFFYNPFVLHKIFIHFVLELGRVHYTYYRPLVTQPNKRGKTPSLSPLILLPSFSLSLLQSLLPNTLLLHPCIPLSMINAQYLVWVFWSLNRIISFNMVLHTLVFWWHWYSDFTCLVCSLCGCRFVEIHICSLGYTSSCVPCYHSGNHNH